MGVIAKTLLSAHFMDESSNKLQASICTRAASPADIETGSCSLQTACTGGGRASAGPHICKALSCQRLDEVCPRVEGRRKEQEAACPRCEPALVDAALAQNNLAEN